MSSNAGTNLSQRAYSVAQGTSTTNGVFYATRSPSTTDVGNFHIGSTWLNTSNNTYWILVSFSSSGGVITANWINFAGADSIGVDTFTAPGTNPVLPDVDGTITFTGAQVATGTVGANVIRTDSLAANTVTIEIQRTTTAAAADSTLNGVCHFDSSMFSVDSDGFVTLSGGSTAIDSIGVQATSGTGTNPVLPDAAGLITVNGAIVAAQAIPVQSLSNSPNTYQIEVQRAADSTGTDTTSQGLSSFNDIQFSVDANGYVSLIGGGTSPAMQSFTVPAGTSPVVPDASGNIDWPAGNGFAVTGGTNAMTGNMVSPFTGDFTFTGTVTADTFDTSNATTGLTITDNNISADGTDTNINLEVYAKGTGSVRTTSKLCPVPVNTPITADGTYYIAYRDQTIPNISLWISYNGQGPSANREQYILMQVNAVQFDISGAAINILSNDTYIDQQVISNIRVVSDGGAGNAERWIAIDIGNRNGANGLLAVSLIGDGSAVTLLPSTTPAVPVDVTTYGMNQNGVSTWSWGNFSSPALEVNSSSGVTTFNSAFSFPSTDGSANQVLVTDGAGTVTWQDVAENFWSITTVNSTPYVVLSTDYYLSVDTSGAAITIQLPNTTTTGRVIRIKDASGNAATNNLTVTTVGGVVTIDGLTSQVLTVNYESISVIWNGTSYEVI